MPPKEKQMDVTNKRLRSFILCKLVHTEIFGKISSILKTNAGKKPIPG